LLIQIRKKKRSSEKRKFKNIIDDKFGYMPIDRLLGNNLPRHYSILFISPACDQKDEVIKSYIKEGLKKADRIIYITGNIDKIKPLFNNPLLHIIMCHPRAQEYSSLSPNISKITDIANLTELNITIMKVIEGMRKDESKSFRICFDILDDVLINRKVLTTRKWLQEIIPRIRKVGLLLGTLDSNMHSTEYLHAISGLFDGQINIKEVNRKRYIFISRMYGINYLNDETPI
jgi:hypothetical protein